MISGCVLLYGNGCGVSCVMRIVEAAVIAYLTISWCGVLILGDMWTAVSAMGGFRRSAFWPLVLYVTGMHVGRCSSVKALEWALGRVRLGRPRPKVLTQGSGASASRPIP